MDHDAVTKIITRNGSVPYGVGILPNPYANQQAEWARRQATANERQRIAEKICALFEPRFITPPETSELIESIVTASDSRKILELGTCTGFTSLHILRAIIGKEGARLVSVDARPAHDAKWWAQWYPTLEFVEGWTPSVLHNSRVTPHAPYDLVFVDSDHSLEHTESELKALWEITTTGTIFLFHDLPEWQSPTQHYPVEIRKLLLDKVKQGLFHGVVMPTCEQMDCADAWGSGYPKQCNPHLGIFIRQ